MRKLIASLVLLAAALTGVAVQAQNAGTSSSSHFTWASAYSNWSLPGVTPNSYTFNATTSCIPNPYTAQSYNFSTVTPVYINDLGTPTNSEVVTPSTVISSVGTCGFTASTSHSHYAFLVQSGTSGLQEAINNITPVGSASNPAMVLVDSAWYSAIASIGQTASTVISGAHGSTSVDIVDASKAPWVWYSWSGSAYVAASAPVPNFATAGSGSSWTYFVNSELVTLNTGGTTTDTAGNLLPANSVIDMVQGVVNTTITSACTGWQLGDASTAGRFSASDTTLTAGEAVNGKVAITTGIASATTGIYQTSAAKVRITCATGNPGAGKVRVVVYGRTFTPPTS